MAKNDQEEAYDRALSATLARTMDLLKFAEAKNAALLTFCSAWILGSVNLLATKDHIPLGYDKAFVLAISLFCVSGLICIYSFLPKLRPAAFFKRKTDNPPLNLLFFGDLARLSVGRADETLRKAYMPPGDRSLTERYAADLAAQLAINGQIAKRKYQLFNIGACLAIMAIIVLSAPAVVSVVTWLGVKL